MRDFRFRFHLVRCFMDPFERYDFSTSTDYPLDQSPTSPPLPTTISIYKQTKLRFGPAPHRMTSVLPGRAHLATNLSLTPRRNLPMNQESSVVGVYTNLDAAEDAVRKLGEGGFPIQHVSIIAQDLGSEKKIHGFVTACDVAKSSARTGAWVGGVFGLLVGAAFLWVPGVGPLVVAGSLASALLGGLEGAVGGAASAGLLGWLMSLGI